MIELKLDKVLDSPDKRLRKFPWTGIMIHHTGIGPRQKITSEKLWRRLHINIANWLARDDQSYVSTHYQIGRFGELFQIVDPQLYVAYHAGKSSFWNPVLRKWQSGCNDHFVGIELVGDGNKQAFSNEQYEKAAIVCRYLMKEYAISPHMIIGHEMASPGRKVDPGKLFDWSYLYRCIYPRINVGVKND